MGYGYFLVWIAFQHKFCQNFQPLCLFFLPNVPGSMFIPLPTFISDSRVSTFQGLYPGFFIGTLISLIIDGYRLCFFQIPSSHKFRFKKFMIEDFVFKKSWVEKSRDETWGWKFRGWNVLKPVKTSLLVWDSSKNKAVTNFSSSIIFINKWELTSSILSGKVKVSSEVRNSRTWAYKFFFIIQL